MHAQLNEDSKNENDRLRTNTELNYSINITSRSECPTIISTLEAKESSILVLCSSASTKTLSGLFNLKIIKVNKWKYVLAACTDSI